MIPLNKAKHHPIEHRSPAETDAMVSRMQASMREHEAAEQLLEKALHELWLRSTDTIDHDTARLNVGRRVVARVREWEGQSFLLGAIERVMPKRCEVKCMHTGTVYAVAFDAMRDVPDRNKGPMLRPVPKPTPVIVKVGEETMQERQMRLDDREANEKKAALAAAQAVLAETQDLNELAALVKEAAARVKQAEADVKEAEAMVKEAQARVVAERQGLAAARDALTQAVKQLEKA